MTINRERVLELLEMLKNSSAAEMSVTEGDTTIRLARFVAPVAAPAAAGQPAAGVQAPGETPAAPGPDDRVVVRARVVGLFYRGKTAGAEPLVEVGQSVKAGQALGMVEVLRKPTEVVSPIEGTLAEVLVEDGHGVQYGDELFLIKPS